MVKVIILLLIRNGEHDNKLSLRNLHDRSKGPTVIVDMATGRGKKYHQNEIGWREGFLVTLSCPWKMLQTSAFFLLKMLNHPSINSQDTHLCLLNVLGFSALIPHRPTTASTQTPPQPFPGFTYNRVSSATTSFSYQI